MVSRMAAAAGMGERKSSAKRAIRLASLHVLEGEGGAKVPLDEGRANPVEDGGAKIGDAQDLKDVTRVEPGFRRQNHRFAEGLELRGDDKVADELH